MQLYETPQAHILEFIARESLAAGNVAEPSLTSDDSISLGEIPTVSEDVEDW